MAAPSVTNIFTNGTAIDAAQVNTNFTDLINGASDGTKDYSISNLTVGGNALLNGNTTIGNSSADDLTITASLASSIPVKTTNTPSIGSATLGLNTVYFGNGSNSNTVGFKGGVTSSSYIVTLPAAAGTSGQYVTTSGSGTLEFTTPTRPTVQRFFGSGTSNVTGTYTTPAGVAWIRVTIVGGGGGGGGGGQTGGTAGGAGNTSSFGTSLLSVSGGSGGAVGSGSALGGDGGGTPTLSSPAIQVVSVTGSFGGSGTIGGSGSFGLGGAGGTSLFGGSGRPGTNAVGQNAKTNTGAGGGGGGYGSGVSGTAAGGGGGGSGGAIIAIIPNPSSSYSYQAGGAGTAGTAAGANGFAGGTGGEGVVIVEEFYV